MYFLCANFLPPTRCVARQTFSQVVLDKHVRLYHNLVINLKARLEQEACDTEEADTKEQELAELEESLASGGGHVGDRAAPGLDSMSLNSDTPPGAHIVWAGGACGALAYESVDELRVAVESLQRLHAELQEEARSLTARIEESKAAYAADRIQGGDGDRNPIVACLLSAAEAWMSLSPGEGERYDGAEGGDSCFTGPAGSAPRLCDGEKDGDNSNSEPRGSLRSGRSSGRNTPGRGSSSSSSCKRGKAGAAAATRNAPTPGRGERAQRGLSSEQCQPRSQQPSSSGRAGSDGGKLEAATDTPVRRRALFYHLVDAFREYQARGGNQQTAKGAGGAGADDGQRLVGGEARAGGSVSVAGSTAAAGAEGAGGGGVGGELPPIGASCGGGGGTASASDFSVSVRTLCDLGPPDCRDASTQTVAKVGDTGVNSFQMPSRGHGKL